MDDRLHVGRVRLSKLAGSNTLLESDVAGSVETRGRLVRHDLLFVAKILEGALLRESRRSFRDPENVALFRTERRRRCRRLCVLTPIRKYTGIERSRRCAVVCHAGSLTYDSREVH